MGEYQELYHHGIKGQKWGIRRFQSYSEVPRKSGKGGKEISSLEDSTGIEYTKSFGFYSAKVAFGSNKEVNLLVEHEKCKKTAQDILSDTELDKKIRDYAESTDTSGTIKSKNLKCDTIQINKQSRNNATFMYSDVKDPYNPVIVTYDSKTRTINNSQRWL